MDYTTVSLQDQGPVFSSVRWWSLSWAKIEVSYWGGGYANTYQGHPWFNKQPDYIVLAKKLFYSLKPYLFCLKNLQKVPKWTAFGCVGSKKGQNQ